MTSELDASLIEAFLDNHNYTPQEETLLVGELERMKGVKNFDVFVSNASLATGKPMALSYRIRAQMMAGYHATVSPADRFRNIDGVLALQLKNGVLVVFAPADFVFWTKRLENKVNTLESALNKMAGISGKKFWITGKFGPTARKNFESKGWMLKEDANAIFLK